ncbi:MAG TPA: cyclic nucleotide-binding domain-containing protein [Anaerolineaceae bacterium]
MATLDLFHNSTDTQNYAAGEVIFHQGDAGKLMYAVQEGTVEIKMGDRVIQTHGPGGIFGEMALIDDRPRSATAIAASDCRLVPIDERRFMFLVQQTPFFAVQVMRIMADRLRRLMTA